MSESPVTHRDTTTGSATEWAAAIRVALKGKGWTGRDVSVRADYFSMGSAVRISIKNPAVSLAAVKAIAEPAERIDRDGFGEILSGGNRYVSISYTAEAVAALAAPWLGPVRAAFESIAPGSNSLKPVVGTPFLVGRNDNGHHVTLWGEGAGCLAPYGNVESVAASIGERLVSSETA